MCSTSLGHSFVHDVVCRCRLVGVEAADDVDDPLYAKQESNHTMQQQQQQQHQRSPIFVICRKQDPLWQNYIHGFEKQQQLQQKLLSLQQKQQPLSSNAVSSSYNSSVVVSHSPSSGDNVNDDLHHGDADETDSLSTACAEFHLDTAHAISTTTTATDTAAIAASSSKTLEERGSALIRTSSSSVNNSNNHQEQELLTRRALLSLQIKPCSHCAMPLNKMGGCDHIICPACHQDMCYKCGTHRYLEGQGYIRSCAGCQQDYIDHRHLPRNGAAVLCIYLPCCVILMLLLPIVFLVQFIGRVIACVCCCDYSGCNQDVGGVGDQLVLNSDDKEAGSGSIGGLTMTQIGNGPSTISRSPLHRSHDDTKTPNFPKPRDNKNNSSSLHEDVETNIDNV